MARLPLLGLALTGSLTLVAAAVAVPRVTGWEVHTRDSGPDGLAPWHGYVDPGAGAGLVPSLLVALVVVAWGPALARRLSFARLVAVSTVASAAWLVSLALIDGPQGLSRVLGNPYEYLETARAVTEVSAFLDGFVARIPIDAADHWPVHVAGHPPGMTLFFVLVVKIGLGGDLAAGLVVTALAATVPAAVLLTLRALDAEHAARAVAPFLVLTPAAIFLAVSADAVMTAVAAWGLVLLALSARRSLWFALPAGLLFGSLVMLSYGLGLIGCIALAVLVAARTWRPLVPSAAAALAVPLVFATQGFWWPEAFGVLRERYWDGIAADRPAAYWIWANLALLVATVGPVTVAGLARLRTLPRGAVALVVGALASVALADLSLMSKAEVERIWLPFMPWLTVAAAGLPPSWRRPALATQAVATVAFEVLLYTSW